MGFLTLLLQQFGDIYIYKIITLYILNLNNVICQLYLDKAGAKT